MSTENKLTQDQIGEILRLNTEACTRIFEAQQKQALELARLHLEENREIRKDTREGFKAFGEFLMAAVPAFVALVEAQEEKRRAHMTAMEKSRQEHEARMEEVKQEHEARMQELKIETATVASGKSRKVD